MVCSVQTEVVCVVLTCERHRSLVLAYVAFSCAEASVHKASDNCTVNGSAVQGICVRSNAACHLHALYDHFFGLHSVKLRAQPHMGGLVVALT
jgi:hypothetical protein